MFKKLAVFGGITIAIALGVFGGNLLYRQYLKAESEKAEIAYYAELKSEAVKAEGRALVSSFARVEKEFYSENKKFASSQELSKKGGVLQDQIFDSENYTYKINLINDRIVQIVGIPKKDNFKVYTSAAFTVNDQAYATRLCESKTPTKNDPPRMDSLNGNEIPCPEGYTTVNNR